MISYAYDRSLGNAIGGTRYFVVPKLYFRRTTYSLIRSKQSRVGFICVGQFRVFKHSGRRKKYRYVFFEETITKIVRLKEKIKTSNLAIELSHAVCRDEFDDIVDLKTDFFLNDIVGFGLNVYCSVDGDTEYVIITSWLGFVLSVFFIRRDEINLTQRKTPPASRKSRY